MEAERSLVRVLGGLVDDGSLTGASAAFVRGDETSIVTLGFADLARRVPLSGDARFRLASLSKPIISALALTLVEDGVLALDDPIGRWVPELASPSVMRSARGPVHDVVPAAGPVLVRHLLDSTCGWGFPGDLSLPGVEGMLAAVGDGRHRHLLPAPEAWLTALADVPLMFQPGERWLYDTSYDLLGVVLARAGGRIAADAASSMPPRTAGDAPHRLRGRPGRSSTPRGGRAVGVAGASQLGRERRDRQAPVPVRCRRTHRHPR